MIPIARTLTARTLTARTLTARTPVARADAAPNALERALLRRLVLGHRLEDAASAVGLSVFEAAAVVRELQNRFGAAYLSRLLALAVLRAWV